MPRMKAKWLLLDADTLLDSSGNLKVRIDPNGDLTATAAGIKTVHDAFIRPDGSVAFTDNLDMGGHRATNAALPVDEHDLTTKGYVDASVSNLNVRETDNFDLSSSDIANKYVDLSFAPVAPEDVIIITEGAPGLDYGKDYTIINGNRLSWDGYELENILVAGDDLTVIYDRSNVNGGLHDQFIGLDDTPSSYAGQAGKILVVSSTENGLEYAERTVSSLQIMPNQMAFDFTDTGADAGTLFGIYQCIDFSATQDGAIWFNFEFQNYWDYSKDIRFDFTFSFNGTDTGKICRLEAKMWATMNGQDETASSPTYTVTEDITSTADMEGKRYRQLMTSIKFPFNSLNTTNNQSIAMRLKRDTSATNNHSAVWKLVSVIARQL